MPPTSRDDSHGSLLDSIRNFKASGSLKPAERSVEAHDASEEPENIDDLAAMLKNALKTRYDGFGGNSDDEDEEEEEDW
ncbi:hypothetical protein HK096_001967 [Nowakowskiella sp. JEL0078]|nr:hypothetical protein HK096_001967 [Nowakowskiella sp. JEL0078]